MTITLGDITLFSDKELSELDELSSCNPPIWVNTFLISEKSMKAPPACSAAGSAA